MTAHSNERGSRSLDALLSVPVTQTKLIWMDTQGYEGFVRQGGSGLLQARIPLVSGFWPYGMHRANSYEAFRDCIAQYRGFVDLNAGDISYCPLQPMNNLDEQFQKLDTGNEAYTDDLIV
jgi:hypothetical protein